MQNIEKMQKYIKATDEKLTQYLTSKSSFEKDILDAVCYSVNAGGKRLRPVLALEFCNICGVDYKMALPFACATEMIHTYSLIHDDLPSMDNDDFRRGKPTNHKVFGEALAILAGDALLNLSTETICNSKSEGINDEQIVKALSYLSDCSGINGMLGGQVIDLKYENSDCNIQILTEMHAKKTGALFRASCVLGLIAAKKYEKIPYAEQFSLNLGLAFQIKDDILDVEGDEKCLGKPIGSDIKNNKSTFVSLLGLEGAREKMREYTEKSKEALSRFENNSFLIWLSDELLKRES